jgi:hypothetical protein
MKNEFLTKPHDWTRVKRTSETRAEYACAVERANSSEQRAAAGAWLIVDIASAVGLVILLAWVLAGWGN